MSTYRSVRWRVARPDVGGLVALGDDRAMMPREGCLCQFISLLRQNQSPKIASRLKNPMEEASM